MKILIIRLSSIGDIVLTTPIVRCINKQLNNIEIHYLTKSSFASIIESNHHIKKVHTLGDDFGATIKQLKEEKFDLIIDLHKNFRSYHIRSELGIRGFSFPKLNFKKWLLVNFKINLLTSPKSSPKERMSGIHIVDRYLKAVKKLGVVNDFEGLDYFIPKNEEIDLATLPITHQKKYIAFVIGATYFTKRLPTEKIISICKQIKPPIILLGGKDDVSNGDEIAKAVGASIYNACGKYSLNQSASIIKQAYKVITHDTGLMHIAAAFNKDIISIWGNTIPDFGMTPYLRNDKKFFIAQVDHLKCRPCSKLGYQKCPKKHFNCMQLIDEKEIIKNTNL